MKQTIQKCLHWIASDARQTIADVKYAFRRRSQRVLLAVQMAAWVVILGEFIIMSICLDYSWFGEIVVIWYFILLITDSKHLLSVMQCVLSWIAAAAFTVIILRMKWRCGEVHNQSLSRFAGSKEMLPAFSRCQAHKRHRLDTGTFQILQHSPRRGGYTNWVNE